MAMIHPQADRFAGIHPRAARLLLGALVVLMAYGVLIRQRTQLHEGTVQDRTDTDVAMYQKIVERIQAGEGYYGATGSELRQRGYALRPVFSWRLPTLAWLMARLGGVNAGRMVMAGVALATLVLWTKLLRGIEPRWMQGVGAVLLFFPFVLPAMAPFQMFHESWAGVCIALSLLAYARGYWRTSIGVGVLAVFVRELSLAYLVVMLAAAWWQRRRTEAVGWLLAVVAFGVFLGVHAWLVSGQVTPADRAHEGWLHAEGWPLVVKTARANLLLQLAPSWVAGVLLPLALVGLAAWSGPVGTRVALTVGAYVTSFLIVGRSVNAYWGLMYAPLLALGWLLAPQAVASLVRAAGRSRAPAGVAVGDGQACPEER